MLAALVCSAVIAIGAPSPGESEAYRDRAAQAGRSADAQVKLALWCESRGMDAERARHLALAIASDPSHAAARGLLGFVQDGGKWRRPEDVAERPADDPKLAATLAEYADRRDKAPATAAGQWALSQWCDAHGLKLQAEAHARATTRIDPDRKSAWHRLGYKNVDGKWFTAAEIASARREADRQAQANKKWQPRLAQIRDDLRDKGRKNKAEATLAGITDSRAVPSIVRVFATTDPADQAVAVQLLGQIDGPLASRLLTQVALYGDTPAVRRSASETLVRRDPREFANLLIAQFRDLLKYEVRPVGEPGSPGVLLIEGRDRIVRRRYQAPTLPQATQRLIAEREAGFVSSTPNANLGRTALGRGVFVTPDALPMISPDSVLGRAIQTRDFQIEQNLAEVQKAAAANERQIEDDMAAVDRQNAESRAFNARAGDMLALATGGACGDDREAWSRWWNDRQGFAYVSPPPGVSKPVVDQAAVPSYQPTFLQPATSMPTSDCLAAGTAIRTREGSRPIETLKVGDLVLAQDVSTGRLNFEPITVVYHNPPATTMEVELASDRLIVTGIHRFWKVGHGWVMARDLKVGDAVRTLGGVARVRSVRPGKTQPVFNLEVAHARTFFVGATTLLVHDFSLVDPTPEPFDGAE